LREIDGFCECPSLCRVEVPSSIEAIGTHGFCDYPSLRVVMILAVYRLRSNERCQRFHPFFVYKDEQEHEDKHEYGYLNCSRRPVHLGIGWRNVLDEDLENFS
jgi:hypothetical protein